MLNKINFVQKIPPLVLALSLAGVYLNSMAPGLTWANTGYDGGDLITAAATGGVAHPTGYPTYLLLARLFQLLPIETLAFRTNLMSAICAITTVLIVYDLVVRFSSGSKYAWVAGLISAYAFGLSPLLWSQAVITEVYTLHVLFVVIILYLSYENFVKPKQSDLLLGLTFGLGMGNHITIILLFPLLLVFEKPLDHASYLTRPKSFLRRLVWLGMGLLVYLVVPFRALSHPPVIWGNLTTFKGMIWLITGGLYSRQLFALNLQAIFAQIQTGASLLIEQFGIAGLVVGLIGLIFFYRRSALYRNTLWIFFVFLIFALIYSTYDSFVYLIPAFMCFAIWIGLGVGGLLDLMYPEYYRISFSIGLIFILYLFVLAGKHWTEVDASQDFRADNFGRQVLSQSPANAIVFAKGDGAVFSMWYFHFALRNRPDLVVVATDLLHFDWYQNSLRENYPGLEVPGPFPFTETISIANPSRPSCYVEYTQSTDILCFPEKLP